MRTNSLTEAALLVSIFTILSLAVMYIPIISVLMMVVLSVPHAVLTWRNGLKAGLIAVVASAVVLSLFIDIISTFMFITLFALVGTVIGYCSKRYSAGKTLVAGAIVGSISFGIVVFVVEIITGLDIFADMISVYEQSIISLGEASETLSFDVEAIKRQLELLTTYLKPAVLVIFGFMTSYINFKFFGIIGRRLRIEVPEVPSIFEWSFPKWLAALYVIGTALMYFTQPETTLNYVGMNLSIVLTWPVLFQGVALVIAFIGQYIKSRLFFLLLFIMILTNSFIMQVVIILGLFDIFFDYQGWLKERRN
ncbi:MAG: YybS family protein [Clostridia bacterium]